jgi:MinD-like ATPase involved in chromosome partitioning or flagellar assembly
MIFTFYSFKGGVGRSMALANIAELFYARGLKVLMVDFDLEAPGLERYFDVKDAAFAPEEIEEKRGIIDMLHSYKELRSLPRLTTEQIPATESTDKKRNFPFSVEPLGNFIVPVYKGGDKRRKIKGGAGTLSIIPAGQRSKGDFEQYAQRVRSFGWDDFYTHWDGELFFDWFQESVREHADVVLIDSRTGVTEMSGVCTHQLADAVITFVAPNNQNIEGVLKIARSLTNSELIEKGRKGRRLSLIFVPSRVEFNEGAKLDQFADQFQNKLSKFFPKNITLREKPFDYLQIPYVPYYAYTEEVATRESSRAKASKMVKAFSNLADVLEQLLPNPTSERPHIFISYRRGAEPDELLAGEIHQALASDYDVFNDKDIRPGENWVKLIDDELKRADYFIVLLSQRSAESDVLKEEVIRACQLSKEQDGRPKILPIRMNFTEPLNYVLAAYLDRFQWFAWESVADTPRLVKLLIGAMSGDPAFSPQSELPQTISTATDFPEGTMAVESPFYISRSSDSIAMAALRRQGATITIKAPRQYGKSSLLVRLLTAARNMGKSLAVLDFQLLDQATTSEADLFFKSFCSWISTRLALEDRSDEFWRNKVGNMRLCTQYIERFVLEAINKPLVLAIDELDVIFRASFRMDFFSMLRSWSNLRGTNPLWIGLDLIMVTARDPFLFIDNPYNSPFNVGEIIQLKDFSLKETAELNERYKNILSEVQVGQLFSLLGGHPYLTRRALYLVSNDRLTPEQLFAQATDESGPFGDHLRRYLWLVQGDGLAGELLHIIQTNSYKDRNKFIRLCDIGLVWNETGVPLLGRQLYSTYFSQHLTNQV